MRICRIAIDVANNNSAIATALYEEFEDGTRKRIPGTSRLWNDLGANGRNSCLIPSVIIYKERNPKYIQKDYFGHDALSILNHTEDKLNVCANIKKRFFVDNDTWGENRSDFEDIVRYLLDCVDFKTYEKADSFELCYSYPVICSDGDRFDFDGVFWDILKERNLPHYSVNSIDEAECSFKFALTNENVKTCILKELEKKKEVFCLLCDIGGSTMELSLYRFSRKGNMINQTRIDVMCADTPAGRGMGSYRMDKALCNTINNLGVLDQKKMETITDELLLLKWFAPLKEELNNHLRENKVGLLDRLHSIAIPDKLTKNRNVSKEQFEKWCNGYTSSVCKQIKSLLEKSSLTPEQVDVAILTGGGCELYPIEIAINKLLDFHGNKNRRVVRPYSPKGVLDCKITDTDNPDFIDGLCPTEEIASLACVLGNLAEETSLVMPEQAISNEAAQKKTLQKKKEGSECNSICQDTSTQLMDKGDATTTRYTGDYSNTENDVNPLFVIYGAELTVGGIAAGVITGSVAPFAFAALGIASVIGVITGAF